MKLSLCVIARNEGQRIGRCLSSVRDYVDEIVVVDTGSTDQTIEVARKWGALVFHHQWQDDFSAARNLSLEKAGGDWILFLDCDEELAPGSGDLLRATLERTYYEAFFVQVINSTETEASLELPSIRIFRNRPHYRFEGAIHEQIMGAIVRHHGMESIGNSPIRILHHGYDSRQVNIAAKTARNLGILLKYKEEDRNGFYYYNLGSEYLRAGERARARQCFEEALGKTPPGQGFAPMLVKKLVIILIETGCFKEAIRQLQYYQQVYPDFRDLVMLEAFCHLHCGRFSRAAELLERHRNMPGSPSWYPNESNWFGMTETQVHQRVEAEKLDRCHPSLSVCIWGQQEAEVLATAIRSVNEMGNEVIYFDAASTDGSTGIAEQYGATVVKTAWPDSESELFQHILDATDSEWVLLMKADEVLPLESRKKLMEALEVDHPAYLLPVMTWLPAAGPAGEPEVQGSCRLCKRAWLSGQKAAGKEDVPQVLDAVMEHLHFRQTEQYQKEKREQRLLRITRKWGPDSPGYWYQYGRLLFYDRDYTAAAVAFKNGLTFKADPGWASYYYYYAVSLVNLARFQEVLELLEPAIKVYPDYPELHYLLALALYGVGRGEESEQLLLSCLEAKTPWDLYTCCPGTGTYKTTGSLASIYAGRGQMQKALNWFCRAALYPGGFAQVIINILLLKDPLFFPLEEWMQQNKLWNVANLLLISQTWAGLNRYQECLYYFQAAASVCDGNEVQMALLRQSSDLLLRTFARSIQGQLDPDSPVLRLCLEEKLL